MKKFILAISVIIAAIANAATCSWSGNNIAIYASGDSATSYTMYLLDASVTSASAMVIALSKGDTSLIDAATVAETSGIAQGTTAVRWSKTGFGSYTAGDSYTYYTVILNGSIDSATAYMITNEMSATAPSSGSLSMGFGTQASNTWAAMISEEQPTVNDNPIAADKVFDEARVSKPITYPSAPELTGEVGSQKITWNDVSVNVPKYYTASVNGNVVSLKLNQFAIPVIANETDDDGNITIAAVKVTDGKVALHLENTYETLYYAITSSTTLGDDASWTLYDTSAETPVYTLGKTDFEFDAGDAVRFFKAAVADEP